MADTSYSVTVGAYTAKGDGVRSKPVTVCSALPRKYTRTNPQKEKRDTNGATKAHHTQLLMIFETKVSIMIIRGH